MQKSVNWGHNVKKNTKRIRLEYLYGSVYTVNGEGQICLNMCFYDKSSKEESQVLRFK